MRSQNKGQIRIVEAFLAVLIVFSSFAVSSNLTTTKNVTKSDYLTSIALQTLVKLDSDGRLGEFVHSQNWTALRDTLNMVLPVGVCFNMTVYNAQMSQINNATISNGGFGSQQIAFVEYLCTSPTTDYHCYIIHIHLAVAK